MLPTMRNNIFDDFFAAPFFTRSEANMMKTDIKEHDGGYELTVDLPGVKKDDIKAELNDGYLTITAENNSSKDEKDEKGKYICRERYSGSYSRSFYVGGPWQYSAVLLHFWTLQEIYNLFPDKP